MSPTEQVEALEKAILERAEALAEEHRQQAKRARERIQQDSLKRLRLLEERETLVAKAQAEREYRRQVQAAEIHMQAELDRMRWGLVQTVMDGVRARLAEVHADDSRYLPLFQRLLAEAATAIERDRLTVLVSDGDHRQLRDGWEELIGRAVPGKTVALSQETCPCTGGALVRSEDGNISMDNTFEGRMERFEPDLQRVIVERLLPSSKQMGNLFNG